MGDNRCQCVPFQSQPTLIKTQQYQPYRNPGTAPDNRPAYSPTRIGNVFVQAPARTALVPQTRLTQNYAGLLGAKEFQNSCNTTYRRCLAQMGDASVDPFTDRRILIRPGFVMIHDPLLNQIQVVGRDNNGKRLDYELTKKSDGTFGYENRLKTLGDLPDDYPLNEAESLFAEDPKNGTISRQLYASLKPHAEAPSLEQAFDRFNKSDFPNLQSKFLNWKTNHPEIIKDKSKYEVFKEYLEEIKTNDKWTYYTTRVALVNYANFDEKDPEQYKDDVFRYNVLLSKLKGASDFLNNEEPSFSFDDQGTLTYLPYSIFGSRITLEIGDDFKKSRITVNDLAGHIDSYSVDQKGRLTVRSPK